MSYDPSHRRRPPRQERWPEATPPEAWQAYREDDAYQGEFPGQAENQGSYWATAAADYRSQPAYQGASGGPAADPGHRGYPRPGGPDPFAGTGSGYAGAPGNYGDTSGGYPAPGDGYAAGPNGYAGYGEGPAGSGDAYGGYAGASDGYARRSGGYAGYEGYVPRTGGYDQPGYGYDDAGAGHDGAAAGYREPQDGFDGARVGHYGAATGYADPQVGYQDTAGGYRPAGNGRGGAPDDYFPGDEFAGNDLAGDDFAGSAGYPGRDDFAGSAGYPGRDDFAGSAGYPGRDDYAEPGAFEPALAAPDAGLDPQSWQADQDARREAGRRGLIVGAVTGFLAVAVVLGASTLAAAFVRPQASPLHAADRVFIDRTPAALKNAVAAHFGTHAQTVLLLGMYIMIGVLALGIGALARRAAGLGVAGVAALSLGAAFVVITRTGGRVSDVIPSILGGLAGAAALLWLLYASAPVPATRQARGSGPRRAR